MYPLGSDNYMKCIEKIVNLGIDKGTITGTGHYVTFLGGDVHEVFGYLEEVFNILNEEVSHFVIQVTLLCNVPGGEIDE